MRYMFLPMLIGAWLFYAACTEAGKQVNAYLDRVEQQVGK